MNKKGQIPQTSTWIINMITIAVVFITLTSVLSSTIDDQVNTGNFELGLYAKRIIYSPNCFAYDPSDENILNIKHLDYNVGILDYENINEKRLKECFEDDNDKIGIMVYIPGSKNVYYNKIFYEETEPISFAEGYMKYSNTYFVKIKMEDGSIQSKPISIIVVNEK